MMMVGSVKAQSSNYHGGMYPSDRAAAGFTGACVGGISYGLFYSAYSGSKNAPLYATLSSAGVSILASMLTYTYGPNDNKINARQNVTASLGCSAVTITLFRFGLEIK